MQPDGVLLRAVLQTLRDAALAWPDPARWELRSIYVMATAGPDGHDDVTMSHVDWKYGKGVPTRCSFLLIGECIYLMNEKGIASCLEAKTGRGIWQERLKGEFTPSPIFADGRIYGFTVEGQCYVLEPGKTPKVLAINKLDDGCMASPAAVGKALYVRTKTHLYRIEQQ